MVYSVYINIFVHYHHNVWVLLLNLCDKYSLEIVYYSCYNMTIKNASLRGLKKEYTK